MKTEIAGTVLSVSRQWWLKVNTKPVRTHALDGAIFPHVIKVSYLIDGITYTKRKWIPAGAPCPAEGSCVRVVYCDGRPAKAKIIL